MVSFIGGTLTLSASECVEVGVVEQRDAPGEYLREK